MSWDYYLGHPNKKVLIKEDELIARLKDDYEVKKVINDNEGWVKSFILTGKGIKEEWYFGRAEEGYLCCSSTSLGIEDLTNICNTVASKLNLQIYDPQMVKIWDTQSEDNWQNP